MRYPYIVTAEGADDAEYEMLAMAKEDFPEANGFSIVEINKVD